jgi:hypothetical protein
MLPMSHSHGAPHASTARRFQLAEDRAAALPSAIVSP